MTRYDSAYNKAKTSLFTRMTTIDLANETGNDLRAQVRYRFFGLDLGPGGIPIIVDDQLIAITIANTIFGPLNFPVGSSLNDSAIGM